MNGKVGLCIVAGFKRGRDYVQEGLCEGYL